MKLYQPIIITALVGTSIFCFITGIYKDSIEYTHNVDISYDTGYTIEQNLPIVGRISEPVIIESDIYEKNSYNFFEMGDLIADGDNRTFAVVFYYLYVITSFFILIISLIVL